MHNERTGVLLLDKPVGPSSREVLNDVEQRLMVGPIGHAGTLDPLASGILIALAGRARRLQEFFLEREKTYLARVRFGETSPTLDGEGPVTSTGVAPSAISTEETRSLLNRFEGAILQAPPVFSAVRVHGRRAYKAARKGQDVKLEPRPVTIHAIGITAIEGNDWILEIRCASGVYVRSLARDLGDARGCGAYLAELRRTWSGSIPVTDAIGPSNASVDSVRPLSEVLVDEPRTDVTKLEARLLACGNVIAREPAAVQPRFAWFRDRPCFKLVAPAPGQLRSDLLLEDPATIRV